MSFVAKKYLEKHAKQYEPDDPYYEFIVDAKGKRKRVKRDVPPGLSKRDERALRKIRKRAHHLDKGMNLCGFKVGWTFWIGIIPGAGDVANVLLSYGLVIKPARKLDIPQHLVSEMLFNQAIATGVGFVPFVGDIVMAAWKANWRNAHALEAYLRKRGEENLREGGQSAMTEVPDEVMVAVTPDAVGAASGSGSTPGQSALAAPGAAASGSGVAPPQPAARTVHKKGWFGHQPNSVVNPDEEGDDEAQQGLTGNTQNRKKTKRPF